MKKLLCFFLLTMLFSSFLLCFNLFGGSNSNSLESPNIDKENDNIIETPTTPLPPIIEDNENNSEVEKPEISIPMTPIITYDICIKSNTNGLNIRSGMGSNYSSVGYIDKNDMVTFIKDVGNGWYETVYKGKTAYISSKYTSLYYFNTSKNTEVESSIDIGKTLLGYPYIYGAQRYHFGNGILNKNFKSYEYDCSSFTQYIFYKTNKTLLNTTTRTQSVQGIEVQKAEIQRGDLLFFTNAQRYYYTGVERIGHVAIYLGDNYILHTSSDYAVIEPISDKRWSYFIKANRVI